MKSVIYHQGLITSILRNYGKSGLTDAELGRLESLLDQASLSGEYRQGFRDAMAGYMLFLKSPQFVHMFEEEARAAIEKFRGGLNT